MITLIRHGIGRPRTKHSPLRTLVPRGDALVHHVRCVARDPSGCQYPEVPGWALLPGQCQTGHKSFCERPEFRCSKDLLCVRRCCRRAPLSTTACGSAHALRRGRAPQSSAMLHTHEASDAMTVANELRGRVHPRYRRRPQHRPSHCPGARRRCVPPAMIMADAIALPARQPARPRARGRRRRLLVIRHPRRSDVLTPTPLLPTNPPQTRDPCARGVGRGVDAAVSWGRGAAPRPPRAAAP